jgi:hypothetical protein
MRHMGYLLPFNDALQVNVFAMGLELFFIRRGGLVCRNDGVCAAADLMFPIRQSWRHGEQKFETRFKPRVPPPGRIRTL